MLSHSTTPRGKQNRQANNADLITEILEHSTRLAPENIENDISFLNTHSLCTDIPEIGTSDISKESLLTVFTAYLDKLEIVLSVYGWNVDDQEFCLAHVNLLAQLATVMLDEVEYRELLIKQIKKGFKAISNENRANFRMKPCFLAAVINEHPDMTQPLKDALLSDGEVYKYLTPRLDDETTDDTSITGLAVSPHSAPFLDAERAASACSMEENLANP